MATDEDVLDRVRDFFVRSDDFNGIAAAQLAAGLSLPWSELRECLGRLVRGRRADLVFASHSGNPHVKRVADLPPALQLERLAKEGPSGICVYPTPGVIRETMDVRAYEGRAYTARLALAEPQLTPVFFELSVLEQYFRDPRYRCHFGDYEGSVSVTDRHYLSDEMPERDKILLQTFGIGYDRDRHRVVVVFLRYLADLSPEHQQTWKAHEIPGPCTMNSDYEGTSIWGEWPKHHSVYQAFIHEQVEINKLASLMGKPPLFKQTFEDDKRPLAFASMLRPTRRRFEEFAHTLDKMLSENLDREFFAGDLPFEDRVVGRDGSFERRPLNTLTLLERWLSAQYRTRDGEDVAREVLAPLKEVRKLRQPQAHALGPDEYDQSFPRQQDEILERVTLSLRKLRLILSSHPQAKGYVAPEWLDGDKIVFY